MDVFIAIYIRCVVRCLNPNYHQQIILAVFTNFSSMYLCSFTPELDIRQAELGYTALLMTRQHLSTILQSFDIL